jgi:type IV pilus assembly protein PilA
MKGHAGFTLIELLLVIAIIGMLATVVTPNLLQARIRANDIATLAWVRECVTAVEVSRNVLTGAIPAGGACATLVGKPLPSAVATDGTVIVDANNIDFTIGVTVSKGGASYSYNGTEIQ